MITAKGRIVAVISIMMTIIMSLGAFAAPVVTDITKDHWAYEAVMGLVEKGYLGVYNDGSFKGDEPVSRYLLAFVVSKMLTDLEKGTVTATEEDMGVLREVANELRGEMVPLLAALETRVKALEKAELEAGKSLTAERQERKAEDDAILEDLQNQAEMVSALDKSLEGTEKQLTDLVATAKEETDTETQERKAADASILGDLIDQSERIDTIGKSLEGTQKGLSALSVTVQEGLAAERQERKAEAAGILSDLRDQAARIDLIDKSLENTEKGLAALSVAMQEEAAAERKLIDFLKKQGDDSKAETSIALAGLEMAQAKTDAVISGLSVELETLKAVMSDDIDKSVTELSAYLEAEIASRKALETRLGVLEDETAQELAAAVASLREWATAEHAAMAAGFEADLASVEADLATVEESWGKTLQGQVTELKKAMADEAAAAQKLMDAIKLEGDDKAEKLDASIAGLKTSLSETDSKLAAMNREVAAIKAAIGQDIDKAITNLSAYIETESSSRKALEVKLDTLSARLDSLSAILAQTDAENDKNLASIDAENDRNLASAVEALKGLISDEARFRADADVLTATKLELLNKVLGSDIEKAAAGLQFALESEKQERKAEAAALKAALSAESGASVQNALQLLDAEKTTRTDSDAKLAAEIAKLKTTINQVDSDSKAMLVRNAIELQDADSELSLSIADLRVAMDTANVSITSLKDKVGAIETRLARLETSVDVLKANLESTTKLLVSVSDDLNRLKIKQETLEAKLADMQVKTDAKLKDLEMASIDQKDDIDIQAQEREAKLNSQIKSLEGQLAEQNQSMQAEMKKIKGLGITGLILGVLGIIVGVVAIFLPVTP